MNDAPKVYFLAGTGAITAVGWNSQVNYYAVRAGVSGYKSAEYFTRHRERVSMALVPDDALPPLREDLGVRGKLSFRDRRILRMCHVAAAEAMNRFTGRQPVPLIFSGPANDLNLPASLSPRFIEYLIQQSGLPIELAASRLIGTGRTGVLEALALALRYLHDSEFDEVLIGGGDSYQNSELLAALDETDRILAPGVMNGFAPGEGASFVLLTRDPAKALRSKTHLPSLSMPGLSREPGHLFSDEPYRGDGLAQAFTQALANNGSQSPIVDTYSSMNGEHYWAKEYGVAMIRNRERFADTCAHHHPADCYGDLGAATGAMLITLAVQAQLNSQVPNASLIYCSSDQAYRAATCLVPMPLSAVQARHAPAATTSP